MVIWITGISGSGKTTLANAILKKYKKNLLNIVNVDGDVVRELFGNLGFDESSREEQIKRIQKLCIFLERQGLIVIVSALYCNENLMNWNRENFKNYYEIYLEASIDLVKLRDPQGLYYKFYQGKEKNVVGLDIPYQKPKNYDLKVNMDEENIIQETVNKITNKVSIFFEKSKIF
jgi:adenylylsulfate kinase